MKKFFITLNPQTKTGYELVTEHGDQVTKYEVLDIVDEGKTLKLAPNPTNRKYYAISKLKGEKTEISAKEASRDTNNSQPKPKASLTELSKYLTSPEDKAMWQELCKKIERAKLIDKAKAEYEAAKAKYESMKGGN